jgi:hypothetical protein
MAIRANVNPGYRRKLLLIGTFITLFGLWATYDAFITYPPQLEKYNAFLELKNQGLQHQWPDVAKAQGWPEEEPKKRNNGDFYFNYALMAFGLSIGLYVLYQGATASKRWIVLDDDNSLNTYRGKQTPLSKVVELNDSRWKAKGIAVVTYEDDKGRRQRIVLDDFNFETTPTREIFEHVKAELASRPGSTAQAESVSDDPKSQPPVDE